MFVQYDLQFLQRLGVITYNDIELNKGHHGRCDDVLVGLVIQIGNIAILGLQNIRR
jgi:hypothetical protein